MRLSLLFFHVYRSGTLFTGSIYGALAGLYGDHRDEFWTGNNRPRSDLTTSDYLSVYAGCQAPNQLQSGGVLVIF